MALPVEEDESPDPRDIGVFGSEAVVPCPDRDPDAIEEARRSGRGTACRRRKGAGGRIHTLLLSGGSSRAPALSFAAAMLINSGCGGGSCCPNSRTSPDRLLGRGQPQGLPGRPREDREAAPDPGKEPDRRKELRRGKHLRVGQPVPAGRQVIGRFPEGTRADAVRAVDAADEGLSRLEPDAGPGALGARSRGSPRSCATASTSSPR